MTGNAPTFATLFLRVFLPFAFAYFLSYIFRGVNAVIFPYLERDIGITAGDLGLLTSAFFLFFAGCQPVLGVALDRYGPRRVQAVLLAVAAAGSALFGLSLSLGELVLARALIGLGFAGGLMAAIKAITLWYPPQRWGLITGLHMMAGGLGSMAATLPVQWSLSVMTWQGLFFWLAGLCLATAAILFVVVPERAATRSKDTLGEQFRITGIVLTDGFYWRIQPLLSVQHETLLPVICWQVEVAQSCEETTVKVVDELPTADRAVRLPDQQRADRVLPQDGVKQPTNLLLAPDHADDCLGMPHEHGLLLAAGHVPDAHAAVVATGDGALERQQSTAVRLVATRASPGPLLQEEKEESYYEVAAPPTYDKLHGDFF